MPTNKHNGNTIGNNASNTPINDPTPFPPLNPAKIGYVWPKTAEKPHNICINPISGIEIPVSYTHLRAHET